MDACGPTRVKAELLDSLFSLSSRESAGHAEGLMTEAYPGPASDSICIKTEPYDVDTKAFPESHENKDELVTAGSTRATKMVTNASVTIKVEPLDTNLSCLPESYIKAETTADHPGAKFKMVKNGGRSRFTITDDLALLREARSRNPFRDASAWLRVASGVQCATGKVFTSRAVKDRCDLLLSQYVNQDRESLRKSGTEEEYSEKEHLLQELVDLTNEFAYKFHQRQRKQSQGRQESRQIASATRDSVACAAYTATNLSCGAELSPLEDALAVEEESPASQLLTAIISHCDVDLDSPQSSSATDHEVTSPGAALSSSSGGACNVSGQENSVARNGTPKGKRKQDAADFEFLEKRMRHEMAVKEKEFALESRRLALEESRLELERERMRHQSEEARLNRQMLATQQETFLKVLETIIHKLAK
uniref:Uncharacterized protein n=2 Tax=Ornithodoros erraticus TaxID=265619 RepID=A0A293LEY1_ORNER